MPRTVNPWRAAARDAWSVVWRCLAVLTALAAVVAVVVAVAYRSDDLLDGATGSASIVGIMWLIHVAVTLVVGYPVGLVVSRPLLGVTSRAGAAGWFALAGAVSGAAVVMIVQFPPVVWFVLGGVVAGGARAWAHGPIRRRADRDAQAHQAAATPWPSPATPVGEAVDPL